jgi:hypothetical protein
MQSLICRFVPSQRQQQAIPSSASFCILDVCCVVVLFRVPVPGCCAASMLIVFPTLDLTVGDLV